jgi:hypothetical protein
VVGNDGGECLVALTAVSFSARPAPIILILRAFLLLRLPFPNPQRLHPEYVSSIASRVSRRLHSGKNPSGGANRAAQIRPGGLGKLRPGREQNETGWANCLTEFFAVASEQSAR